MANNINKIFKVPVSKTINYNEGRKSMEQTEDYAVKKNINTQEGTIEKVPVNPNDICNKAYVDSHSGTAGGTSDHALLSNLTYASSGHIGFAASASIPTVGVDFDAVGTDNSDDNAINTRYATTVATNTSFRVTPSTVITAGDNISWTGNTLNVVAGSAAAVSHAGLTNLSYASAGHTGFAPALGGDDNYVTDTEKGNLHAPGSDDQDISGIATNAGNITNIETKTDFITVTQAVDLDTMESNIATNNAKISFTWDYDYSDLINNPTTITAGQATAITANTAKISYNSTASTKLGTIEESAEVNNISDANATDLTDGGDTTLHDHNGISENTSARHTQNTDTALGSGAVAADHGTAATDMIINVCYGTSATPPTANTTTEGTLYIQYTA